ncbi:MAG: beta-galactosidase [Verrucomicrobiota bacterium]
MKDNPTGPSPSFRFLFSPLQGLALAAIASLATPSLAEDGPGWWMTEPVRLVQTNIPIQMWENLSAEELIDSVQELGGNTWLFNVGGIYANYPTELSFQAKNPFLAERGDLMEEIYRLAEERDIRLLARFDFSRFPESVAEAHPEWCFRRENGETIHYNGLVTSCINGGYYRSASTEMIKEFLNRYPAEAVFVNWWSHHAINGYSGIPNGVCHCESCKARWAEFSDKPLPKRWNADYRRFLTECGMDTARLVRAAIKEAAPSAAFLLYGTKRTAVTDGFTAESKTNYTPNIWWPYQSSYLVNLARNSHPDQMVFNTVVNFIKMPFRFEPHRSGVNQNRMLQGMAHGGFPALYMVGPLTHPHNRHAREAMSFPLAWHADHEEFFPGQVSKASIALVADGFRTEELRGLFCLLSEAHLPFSVFEKTHHFPGGDHWDLVISSSMRGGGLRRSAETLNHLLIGTKAPPQFDGQTGKLWSLEDTFAAYWRVSDPEFFPQLGEVTELLGIESEYLEVTEPGTFQAHLPMVPPAYHSTTEITHLNRQDGTQPGLLLQTNDQGKKTIWLPWEPGTIYHLRGNDSLRLLFDDLFHHLLDGQPQIKTEAHPLVEMSFMEQADHGRDLVHLVNLTNQLHGAGGQLLEMDAFEMQVRGSYARAYLASDPSQELPLSTTEGYTAFTVPSLGQYNIVVLEHPQKQAESSPLPHTPSPL